jgi:sulfate adenylyltransferase
MFQSKEEAQKELAAAKLVYESVNGSRIDHKKLVWNPLKYDDYR